MKARAGCREKVDVKPVIDPISQLSDAELEAEINRLNRELGHEPRLVVQIVDETSAGQDERL
ncbi:hypothetical protein [Roseomonas rosulenta]|uniref:hypothetical protein n=1 Tax=Roseomonas rosulenta TaxID=2748667 RepID=UPI0018E02688|nr:hypothetical protein [Roseomonas rosulenta]